MIGEEEEEEDRRIMAGGGGGVQEMLERGRIGFVSFRSSSLSLSFFHPSSIR